jgi:hypothetical protein
LTSDDELDLELDRAARVVLLHGPITVYRAQQYFQEMKRRAGKVIEPGKKDPPLSTVHGHFTILEEEGEIVVYSKGGEKRTGRGEKYYGMTLYGFLWNLSRKLVDTKFATILKRWLGEDDFNFFLPKEEVLRSIEDEKVASSLGEICLAISNGLPDTRNLLDFLWSVGYDESNPHVIQLLIQFVLGASSSKNPEAIIAALKVLCNTATLPSARKEMKQYVESQRKSLATMEEVLGLVEK